MNMKFDTERFNLQTTSYDIPEPCVNALYGSCRRNTTAAIVTALKKKYGLDKPGSSLLFRHNRPIVTTNGQLSSSETIRIDPRHSFVVRCVTRKGLTIDIPANRLSTDTMMFMLIDLNHGVHPF